MAVEKRLEPYMKGAEMAVECLGIDKGREVLFVITAKTDRNAVDAVVRASRAVGARVSILEVEETPPNQPYPRVCVEAARGVDIWCSMGGGPSSHHKDGFEITYDIGAQNVGIETRLLTSPAALYPLELWYELTRRVKRQIGHKDIKGRHIIEMKAVDDRGTDLHWRVRYPEDIAAYIGAEPLEAGPPVAEPKYRYRGRAGFPRGSCVMGDLMHSATGVLFADAAVPFAGWIKPPLKFTLKDGYVTEVEGGPEAKKLKDLWKPYPNANRLREIGFGTNPHTPLDFDGPFSSWITRRAGTLFFGFGGDTGVGGTDPSSEDLQTTFCLNLRPTVYADDKAITDNGRLTILDDPELREFAKKFGDPAKLLNTI